MNPAAAHDPFDFDEYFSTPDLDWKRVHAVFRHLYLKFVKNKPMMGKPKSPDILLVDELIEAYVQARQLSLKSDTQDSNETPAQELSIYELFRRKVYHFWHDKRDDRRILAGVATIVPAVGLVMDIIGGGAVCGETCPYGSHRIAPPANSIFNITCVDDITNQHLNGGAPNDVCTTALYVGIARSACLALPYGVMFAKACAEKWEHSMAANTSPSNPMSCKKKIRDRATKLNQALNTLCIEEFCKNQGCAEL